MSIPTNQELTKGEEVNTRPEDIRLTGERLPVEQEDTTVKDDAEDYIFLKPKRAKHRSTASGTIRRAKKRKKMKTWKKFLIGFVCGILAIILIFGGTAFYLIFKGQSELFLDDYNITAPKGVQVDDGGRYVHYNGHTYRLNESVTNLLFMGVDKRDLGDVSDYGTQGQADVIVMMAYDTKHKKITMINVPRDLMTDVPIYTADGVYSTTKKQQICLAYAYGDGKDKSCDNVKTVVERLFYNMPVKTYFALDMDGIVAVNDSVGGVDVVSPETIETFVKGQSYHLMGEQSERFVRARVHDTAQANLLRNERQKVYATSFMSGMLKATKKNLSVPVNIFNASAPYSATNLSAAKVSFLAKEVVLGGNPQTEVKSVEGETKLKGNYAQFTLKEREFYELFLSVYYDMVK